METIFILLIIALLGFLALTLVNCTDCGDEEDKAKSQNKHASRNKGSKHAKQKILGKNAPSSLKLSSMKERHTESCMQQAVIDRNTTTANLKSSIGGSMSSVSGIKAQSSSSIESNAKSSVIDTRPKLRFNPELGPILVDRATYDVLKEKYNMETSPSKKSINSEEKSALATSTMFGSQSSRLSHYNYKTQSFSASKVAF